MHVCLAPNLFLGTFISLSFTWPTKYTLPDIPPSEHQIEVHFIFQRSDNKEMLYTRYHQTPLKQLKLKLISLVFLHLLLNISIGKW